MAKVVLIDSHFLSVFNQYFYNSIKCDKVSLEHSVLWFVVTNVTNSIKINLGR